MYWLGRPSKRRTETEIVRFEAQPATFWASSPRSAQERVRGLLAKTWAYSLLYDQESTRERCIFPARTRCEVSAAETPQLS